MVKNGAFTSKLKGFMSPVITNPPSITISPSAHQVAGQKVGLIFRTEAQIEEILRPCQAVPQLMF